MPEEIADVWLNCDNPVCANLYAPILWKVYVNNNFPTNGIPYLKCRRWIYYNYKCEEGAMKKLEMLRLEKKMVELDLRVKEAVVFWYNKSKGKNQ